MKITVLMRRIVVLSGVVLLTTGMMGCGEKKWFRNRANDYKTAESSPPLEIPACVSAEPFSQDYAIPGR